MGKAWRVWGGCMEWSMRSWVVTSSPHRQVVLRNICCGVAPWTEAKKKPPKRPKGLTRPKTNANLDLQRRLWEHHLSHSVWVCFFSANWKSCKLCGLCEWLSLAPPPTPLAHSLDASSAYLPTQKWGSDPEVETGHAAFMACGMLISSWHGVKVYKAWDFTLVIAH